MPQSTEEYVTDIVQINAFKFNGTLHKSWIVSLDRQDNSKLVFKGVFNKEINHADLGKIKKGTLSTEYFWLDRWYSIFCFYKPDGTLRNYYCNINTPPAFDGRTISYTDLDIDILVYPDLSHKILDTEEFKQNSVTLNYPDEIKLNVKNATTELLQMIKEKQFPFNL